MVRFVIQILRYISATLCCSFLGGLTSLMLLLIADQLGMAISGRGIIPAIHAYLSSLPGVKFDPLADMFPTYFIFIFIGLVMGFVWGNVFFVLSNKRRRVEEMNSDAS